MDKRMRALQEQIYACTASHVETASTEELGEAVDMIKDLAEGIYYEQKAKLLTKELECLEKDKEHHYVFVPYYRDMDREQGRMYYTDVPRTIGRNKGRIEDVDGPYMHEDWDDEYGHERMKGREREYPMEMRDHREGTSPIHRKYYMEAKELKHDKKAQMEELEKYMQELSRDITEMIGDASPEETTLLKQKLVTLIEKIR